MATAQRPLAALALRVGSALAFSTMAMFVKYAGESGVAIAEIMFWRQLLAIPLIVGFLLVTRRLDLLRTQRFSAHARRALLGMTNMIFLFGSLILLPLPMATTLSFTAPVFAVVLSAMALREHVGPYRWGAVVLGFLGVLVIVRPTGEGGSALGVALGLIAAVLMVLINFQIRDLGRTEPAVTSAFHFAVVGTAVTGLAMPFFATAHNAAQWASLGGIGLSGTIGQLLLAASLRRGQVTSVMAMDYVALLGATFYGWLIWDSFPPATTWLGAPLIVAAGAVIAWREHKLGKAALSAEARPELTS